MDFAQRFDQIIRLTQITAADLARALSYDPSLVSRIRSGQRVPQDRKKFATEVAAYVARHACDDAFHDTA